MSEWKCPKCGAPDNAHGKGECKDLAFRGGSSCLGLLCECEVDEIGPEHGHSHADPCSAYCHHCGWSGTFPPPLKGILPWEKKALAAGWTPPAGWEATKKNGGKTK